MTKKLKGLLFFVSLLLIFGCGSQKKIIHVKPKSTKHLLENLAASEVKSEWVSLKANVAFTTDKTSDSFKMNIRLHKDSALWISTTYFSVEVARLLITPDSVKFMDRKQKQYFVGDFNYINKRFNIGADFEAIQAIILGNSVGILDGEKVKSYTKNKQYHLSSVGRRKLKKAEKKVEKEKKVKTDYAFSIALNPETFKVENLHIFDYIQDKSLLANYTDFQKINDTSFPEKYQLLVRAEKNIETNITYSKVVLNKKLKMSFNIPSKYERIE